ncbi:LysR substrate-binding domain-containing protein [Caenispirillum bisanense]|uniref:Transcriptional regulator, LysR family n=1 Tax=Caenispirillum bisanense TaxID=414052 RepID=A0A286GKD2_9PROT|nr:LysR substrate-binding domain-containing protein [Caenispirillum bisanense]SOD95991.1 transcriptional regulator, LysR family [Caenispirillum bisanense]
MELRHLRYFVAVAEDLHFGRAAARLHLSQPSLSQQIQALEERIGAALFVRNRRKVELTAAGRLMLPEARATLAQAEKALVVARRAGRGEVGRLEIGFTGSAPFNPLLPQSVRRFRERWPDVQLSLNEMSTTAQFEALAAGRLDVGFLRPGQPMEMVGIAQRLLLREPLLAVMTAAHPLAAGASVRVADLATEPFILHPRAIGTGLFDKVMTLCAAAGFAPRIAVEAHQMSTVVTLAAVGMGVSIVPEALRRLNTDGVAFRPIDDDGAFMDLIAARRADDDTAVVRNFFAVLPEAV